MVLILFQSCHNAGLALRAMTLFCFHGLAPSEISFRVSNTFWLSVMMRAEFRARYVSKLSVLLNSDGSPRSPNGV